MFILTENNSIVNNGVSYQLDARRTITATKQRIKQVKPPSKCSAERTSKDK